MLRHHLLKPMSLNLSNTSLYYKRSNFIASKYFNNTTNNNNNSWKDLVNAFRILIKNSSSIKQVLIDMDDQLEKIRISNPNKKLNFLDLRIAIIEVAKTKRFKDIDLNNSKDDNNSNNIKKEEEAKSNSKFAIFQEIFKEVEIIVKKNTSPNGKIDLKQTLCDVKSSAKANADKIFNKSLEKSSVKPVIQTDIDEDGQRLKVEPENSQKFKDFEVFSNFNSSWINEYLNRKLPALSTDNEDRLVFEINKYLSIDNECISKDDLMSKTEIYEGVKDRFLINHCLFNKMCKALKNLKNSEVENNGKEFKIESNLLRDLDADSNFLDLNIFMTGVLKRKFDAYFSSGYVPTTKVVTDLNIKLISVSKFKQDLTRFTPWGGPTSLIGTLLSHFRRNYKTQVSESANILMGNFIIPRFLITFDEQLELVDKVESGESKIIGVFKRKVIMDFIVVENGEGFSFREFAINTRGSTKKEEDYEL